jgi:hypothetical protein
MKWLCCQLGAREHYAIPRALNSSPDGRQIAKFNLVFESFVFYFSLPNGCQMAIYSI